MPVNRYLFQLILTMKNHFNSHIQSPHSPLCKCNQITRHDRFGDKIYCFPYMASVEVEDQIRELVTRLLITFTPQTPRHLRTHLMTSASGWEQTNKSSFFFVLRLCISYWLWNLTIAYLCQTWNMQFDTLFLSPFLKMQASSNLLQPTWQFWTWGFANFHGVKSLFSPRFLKISLTWQIDYHAWPLLIYADNETSFDKSVQNINYNAIHPAVSQ